MSSTLQNGDVLLEVVRTLALVCAGGVIACTIIASVSGNAARRAALVFAAILLLVTAGSAVEAQYVIDAASDSEQ